MMDSWIFIALYIISSICLWILLTAILLNFYFARKGFIRKEKRSVVETGSMLAFFLLMVVLVYLGTGRIESGNSLASAFAITGTILIIAGTAVNIAGRFALKGNWGNQIKIYDDHSLITDGIYHYTRHPLYSSTILMLIGFSFLFRNYLVLFLTIIVFTPFMVYRAKQEEDMLMDVFKDGYPEYKRNTGMFVPKIIKKR
ncbi:MAG: methyltransferase family protein [Saccharofermentanales bacterium]